jgi:ParB family transcriptional regulator, chromosome partitioning protein
VGSVGRSQRAKARHIQQELREVRLDEIDLPRRPVRRFLGDIADLADSMQDFGLQQPITVRAEANRFILTSGLRRVTAARLIGWTTITAFVRNVSADQAYVLDLIENLQRQDLSPEEEADALGELVRTRGWTLQQVADTVKRSLAYVSKRLRVFEDDELRDAVANKGLPISTAEELLAADADDRSRLLAQALAEGWDQVHARAALRAAAALREQEPTVEPPVADREAVGLVNTESRHQNVSFGATTASAAAGRPRGLTRAVREFHRLIADLRAQDLTPSDRAALRSLYRDLLMLARAPATATPRILPPLPTMRHTARR